MVILRALVLWWQRLNSFENCYCAAAAIDIQLQGIDPVYQKNMASILAGLATFVLTLDTAGSFGKRWRVCRLSESKTKELTYNLFEHEPTSADVQKLIQIEREHSDAITS